jgi:hypothetical protein
MKREMLEVVDARPPHFDKIKAVLPGAEMAGVMFAYDGKVYFPGSQKKHLTRELDAHERVHIVRQIDYVGGPEAWWDRYLRDEEFRYNEELLAHRAEYKQFCARHINPLKRAQALRMMAARLASPLYAAGVTVAKATADLLAGK